MATATPPQSTQLLSKPVVCTKCKTTHFEYTLACKRCGDYLDNKDVAEIAGGTNLGSKIMGAAAVCVTILAVCVMFRIF